MLITPPSPDLAPPRPPRTGGRYLWVIAVIALSISIAVAVLSGNDTTSSDRDSAAVAGVEDADASARMACRHFRNIAFDARDGILTESQLLEKIREVDGSAHVSENSGVRVAARSMLRDVTQGADASASVTAMNDACTALGL